MLVTWFPPCKAGAENRTPPGMALSPTAFLLGGSGFGFCFHLAIAGAVVLTRRHRLFHKPPDHFRAVGVIWFLPANFFECAPQIRRHANLNLGFSQ